MTVLLQLVPMLYGAVTKVIFMHQETGPNKFSVREGGENLKITGCNCDGYYRENGYNIVVDTFGHST